MKKNFLTSVAFALALGLVACDDSTSANGSSGDENPAEESSSSVIPSEVEGSSSSSKANWAYLNPDKTYGTMTDSRDGQVYKTVTIGSQTWMAENLNYRYVGIKYAEGTSYESDSTSWCYENKASNCDKYGRLYTWEVAMNDASCAYGNSCHPSGTVQGVCPSGWHLPTKEEWQQLVKPMAYSVDDYPTYWYYYGAGIELKTVDDWYSSSNKGTNASGFSALPAGYRYYDGFLLAGYRAKFWSASEYDDSSAYRLNLYYDDAYAYLDYYRKGDAFSVRCVQN